MTPMPKSYLLLHERVWRTQVTHYLLSVIPDDSDTLKSLKSTVSEWVDEMRLGMEPPASTYVNGAMQLAFREAGNRGRFTEGVTMDGDTVFAFTPFQAIFKMSGVNKRVRIVRAVIKVDGMGSVTLTNDTEDGCFQGFEEILEETPVVSGMARRLKSCV